MLYYGRAYEKKDEIMHEPNSSLPKDIVKETNLYDQNNYRLHSS